MILWNPLHQCRLLVWLCSNPARYIDFRAQVGEEAARNAVLCIASSLTLLPVWTVLIFHGFQQINPVCQLTLPNPRTSNTFQCFNVLFPNAPLGFSYPMWVGFIPLLWIFVSYLNTRNSNRDKSLALTILYFAGKIVAPTIIFVAGGTFMWFANSASKNSTTVMAVSTAGLLAYLLGVGVLRFISDNIADSIAPAGLAIAPLLAGKFADLGLDGIAFLIAYIAVGFIAEGIIFGTAFLLYTSVERGQATLASRLVLVTLALSYASLVWLLLMLG